MSRKAKAKKKEVRNSLFEISENSSELNEPQWAVVSWDSVEARNLTYAEASELLQNRAQEKTSGLCIITNEAASRFLPKK